MNRFYFWIARASCDKSIQIHSLWGKIDSKNTCKMSMKTVKKFYFFLVSFCSFFRHQRQRDNVKVDIDGHYYSYSQSAGLRIRNNAFEQWMKFNWIESNQIESNMTWNGMMIVVATLLVTTDSHHPKVKRTPTEYNNKTNTGRNMTMLIIKSWKIPKIII